MGMRLRHNWCGLWFWNWLIVWSATLWAQTPVPALAETLDSANAAGSSAVHPATAAWPVDPRLRPARDLNHHHPSAPPQTLTDWQDRAKRLREQVLVAAGLWPMPTRQPPAVLHLGSIRRPGYQVEKITVESLPGHWLTGNLYLPCAEMEPSAARTSEVATSLPPKRWPAVLCPHGHWHQGRLYDANSKTVEQELASGAESFASNARFPLQARMVELVRHGCIVFHYDMVGYADSLALGHRDSFLDPESLLWLHSVLGLQTWNSLRAVDYLLSRPDVDPEQILVTGGSGGGTQTFLLAAVDDRIRGALPAVMVSTHMQGGCVCENAPYLRIGTNNVELAALIAPKPLGLIAADDWTRQLETDGLPQLRQLYRLYGASQQLAGKCYPKFGHNYNQFSREFLYSWLRDQCGLSLSQIAERPIEPILPIDLRLFAHAADHPVRQWDWREIHSYWQEQWRQSWASKRSAEERRTILLPALETMLGTFWPASPNTVFIHADKLSQASTPNFDCEAWLLRRPAVHLVDVEQMVPCWLFHRASSQSQASPTDPTNSPAASVPDRLLVLVSDDATLTKLGFRSTEHPEDCTIPEDWLPILERHTLVVPSVLLTGNSLQAYRRANGPLPADASQPIIFPNPIHPTYAGYTFCYNRPLLAERVRDLLTTLLGVGQQFPGRPITLVGLGDGGSWALLAAGLLASAPASPIEAFAVTALGVDLETVTQVDSPWFLPGAAKYGGLDSVAELVASQTTEQFCWYRGRTAHASASELTVAQIRDWLLNRP